MKKNTIVLIFLAAFTLTIFPAEADLSVLEAKVFKLVNAERIKAGLRPLKKDIKLASIAKKHSEDMAKHDYTSHVNLAGLDPSDRAEAAGYNIVIKKKEGSRTITRRGVGENIYERQAFTVEGDVIEYYIEDYDKIANIAVESWMKSPGHRKNIMNPDYTLSGVGISLGDKKKIRITQVFF